MDTQIAAQLMREAIEEAKRSISEDNRPHPKVGAILADEAGKILYRSHRGEEKNGGHAEFHILSKAAKDGASLKDSTLFVTLEPCTRRGPNKVPCAIRVAESGIKKLFIGTLDPNPHITGRGEMYLSYNMEVDRFPGKLARELQQLNKEFFEQHRNNQIPAVSLYAGGKPADSTKKYRPALAGQREGILQQSMDLMSGTSGDIFIFAGDLSWLRELQISLVLASYAQRRIRILCDKANKRQRAFYTLTEIARRLGADVGLYDQDIPLRGTLVSPDTDHAAMMCVEKEPTKHAILFQAPHESGIIKAISLWANDMWKTANVRAAYSPELQRLDSHNIAEVLKRNIPQYAEAEITVCEVKIDQLRPLSTSLERFKLSRLNQVSILQEQSGSQAVLIKGSPWPIFPPVVEELPNGTRVIVDGAHRAYVSLRRGLERIEVILVSGKTARLPALPLDSWDEVGVKAEKLPREDRYRCFDPAGFREIRSVVSKYVSQMT